MNDPVQIEPIRLRDVLRSGQSDETVEQLRDTLRRLSPGDAVAEMADLSRDEVGTVVRLIGAEMLADLLENVASAEAVRLLVKLGRVNAADVLEAMDVDDATDVIEEMAPDEAEAVLIEMEPEDAEHIRELMAYPPHSAAGRMSTEVVTVGPDLTVDEALRAIRRLAATAETIYYIYVTDDQGHLIGVLNLRDLVLAQPATPLAAVTIRDPVAVRADEDQEIAARRLAERGLLALPVIDAENHILGIITADDVSDILEQEATEDIARLGGSQPLSQPYARAGVGTLIRTRVGWLLVLFLGGAITSDVLNSFEETLSQVVALMFFVPLLVGIGGNVGAQIVTTLVRAMAVDEIRGDDIGRVLGKELLTALGISAVMAAAAAMRAWTLGVDTTIGAVVALAAACIVVWAATVGAILPFVLRRFGIDPAVVSAPLISTLVDGTGLLLYLTVARAFLAV